MHNIIHFIFQGAYDHEFKKIAKETKINLDDVIKLVEDLTRIH